MATIGKNSPTAPLARIARPNGRPELAGVPEDRQQGTQGRGGESDGHRQERADEPERGQDADDRHREHECREPRSHGRGPVRAPQHGQVQLVPGHEEEESEPEVRDQIDLGGWLGDGEHLRADDDAEQQEKHDLRDPGTPDHADDQRREGRDQDDDRQRAQALRQLQRTSPT